MFIPESLGSDMIRGGHNRKHQKIEAPCSKLQGIFDCKEFYNF
jgi:hypothetical protein